MRGGNESINERKGNLNGGAVAKAGISFGSALAMVISYTTWHSGGGPIAPGVLWGFFFI